MSLKRQRGVSFFGILFVGSFLGLLIVSGLNIMPLYLDDMKLSSIFKSLEKEGSASMTRKEVIQFIQRRMDINQMEYDDFGLSELKIESMPGNTKRISLEYEARAHVIGNLDAVASFSHEAIVH